MTMRRVIAVFALVLAAPLVGACGNGVVFTDGGGKCPAPPVLAAPTGPALALSCSESVSFRGRDYSVGCLPVHDSREGRVIESDGGDTSYAGARAIRGISPERALILMGQGCGKRDWVATVEDFSEAEFDLARSPLGKKATKTP